ncbi:MAG: hypothetical protein PHV82_04395 [Victivallaceae bacterium]|nr:hypothetical protein [Victivallaceae bacterium]
MSKIKIPVGVCLLKSPESNCPYSVLYPEYVTEILRHAGICFEMIENRSLFPRLDEIGVLITVGEQIFTDTEQKILSAWLKKRGAWISIGGICGMNNFWNASAAKSIYPKYADIFIRTLSEGWLVPKIKNHPLLAHITMPLHYFNGLTVLPNAAAIILATTTDKHQRENEFAALLEVNNDAGLGILIAVDIFGTIVRIQQGTAITRDGTGPSDGTAPINDKILKSDDGCVLDWEFDRKKIVETDFPPFFTQPIADQWREMLIRAILYTAQKRCIPIPILWQYPRNLPALAHLSHDSDGNEIDNAEIMLETLNKAAIHSTWCILIPGYPKKMIKRIQQNGHELAAHLDFTGSNNHFCQEEFSKQYTKLSEILGEEPISNKNHYLRWEGDSQFWEWCMDDGVQMDSSKCPSKAGNSGFLFGTCQPYFPMTPDAKVLDVLELPALSLDFCFVIPPSIGFEIMKTAHKYHGIFHVVFHPAHIRKKGVQESLFNIITKGKNLGMEWWTAKEINTWERARRSIIWSSYSTDQRETTVCLKANALLNDASLLWLAPHATKVTIDGKRVVSQTVEFWGFGFISTVISLQQDKQIICSVIQK